MSEGHRNFWLPLAAGVIIVALGVFASLPQGRDIIRQALYSAGLIYAGPMTGLD